MELMDPEISDLLHRNIVVSGELRSAVHLWIMLTLWGLCDYIIQLPGVIIYSAFCNYFRSQTSLHFEGAASLRWRIHGELHHVMMKEGGLPWKEQTGMENPMKWETGQDKNSHSDIPRSI